MLFQQFRYNTEGGIPLDKVLAPPYDVISDAYRQELCARHENNIVQIDFNAPLQEDDELARYNRAKQHLDNWQKKEVLIAEKAPCLYILKQEFSGPDGVMRTRTGVFTKTKLSKFGEGEVMPHERTLKGPKLDRLRLFRATDMNLSPIFGMIPDPAGTARQILSDAQAEKALVETEYDNTTLRFWRMHDEKLTAALIQAASKQRMYIADGHHRYETGIAYREERRAAQTGSGSDDFGYESILTFICAVEDEGMQVFPTHRLVHSLSAFDYESFLQQAGQFFDLSSCDDKKSALSALRNDGGKTQFIAATQSGYTLMRLKDDASLDEVPSLPEDKVVRAMDVSILHGVVLEHIMGISREDQANQKNLKYSKLDDEAMCAPTEDRSIQVAFVMNPTKISEVIDASDREQVLPQKSTFFYPKVPTGLVLYPLS